jgi:hypothetical protein
VEFGNPAHGFRSPPVVIQRKDFGRQRVKLLVQYIDALETKELATTWQYHSVYQRSGVQPDSKSALVEIQHWCTLPLAIRAFSLLLKTFVPHPFPRFLRKWVGYH